MTFENNAGSGAEKTLRTGRAEIVGLGLIGSSIALALRRSAWHVSGRDINEQRAQRALELGVIDAVGSDMRATLGVVATPVGAIASCVRELLDRGGVPIVVTDVGSVKGSVVAAIDDPSFVGGHPMAGSEQEGPDGADPDLFIGANWVLTPTPRTSDDAFTAVRGLVGELGAEVVVLDPSHHDEMVALVSHVPHLAAANLMALAADASDEHAALMRLAAGGFRDMTRIAAGDPAMWPDIFEENADAVLAVLDSLVSRLDAARRAVAKGDRATLLALLEYAKLARRNLPARVTRPEDLVECRVPVLDRPGVLAEVTTILGGLGVNIWDLEIAHSAEGERGVLVLAINADAADHARDGLVDRGYHPVLRRLT